MRGRVGNGGGGGGGVCGERLLTWASVVFNTAALRSALIVLLGAGAMVFC